MKRIRTPINSVCAAGVAHPPTAAEVSVGLPAAPLSPTHDEIAARAYAIYENQGCRSGHCNSNWHQAEWALRVERQAAWSALQSACTENPASYFDSTTSLEVDADL